MRNSIEMKVASGLVLKQDLFDSVLNSDNFTDEVDFSEKGRSQFLQLLEDSMQEFIAGSPPPEVPEEDVLETGDLKEMQDVINSGQAFLSALYRLQTGKELDRNRVEIAAEKDEVILRLRIK